MAEISPQPKIDSVTITRFEGGFATVAVKLSRDPCDPFDEPSTVELCSRFVVGNMTLQQITDCAIGHAKRMMNALVSDPNPKYDD
ncbi:hypothetical protein [Paraburkholderia sp. BL10I2N1]|uniref:hypothetical protein n=1 Tax=Paraburkholderia sp. BL10I2N1 TaxID=1938796 RepID=UPI00105BE5E3|nr:hypothetical protein [Paraburkholderia sp. BL10I2N1]TDN63228.1 hypothetical protein B0G77_6865 [Paraburkholderia sp. BL10I2N1]